MELSNRDIDDILQELKSLPNISEKAKEFIARIDLNLGNIQSTILCNDLYKGVDFDYEGDENDDEDEEWLDDDDYYNDDDWDYGDFD